MELVINDSSLMGQYENEYVFRRYLEDKFIPLLNNCLNNTKQNILFSKSNLFESKITKNNTLEDFLYGNVTESGSTARQVLIRLIYSGNYWDTDPKIRDDASYIWKENEDIPVVSLYEAAERDKLLISFDADLFSQLSMTVEKNSQYEIVVNNFIDLPSYLSFYEKESEKKIVIEKTNQYHAVVYKKEDNHPPHFHILYQGKKSGAYQLPGLEERDISFPARDKKKIDEWIKVNLKQLINCWNTVHPDRLIDRIVIDREYYLVVSLLDNQKRIQIEYCGCPSGIYLFDTKKIVNISFPMKDKEKIEKFIEENEGELTNLWNKLHIKK